MQHSLQQYIDKASILVEALPYIQSFRGKTVVVKYGGSTLSTDACVDTVLKDLVFMELVGINPVIVHGGGPAIDRRLQELDIETKRVNGLRITDHDTMQVVEDVLFGEVNAGLVDAIDALGGHAVGVSAREAGILSVRPHVAQTPDGPVELGFVGDVEAVDASPLNELIARGVIPVVAPIGRGEDGAAYNVNADTAAGEIAAAVHAEKLVFLTDVTGIMSDPTDESIDRAVDHRRRSARWHDPEGAGRGTCGEGRGAQDAHHRRSDPALHASRILHRRGRRHADRTIACLGTDKER